MLLATPWVADYGLPADVIKGALPISGLFDLAPFPYSWLQPKLQITWDQVRRCSPLSNLPPHPVPTIVAVGGEESAEFQRQSRDYVDRLREHGVPATFLPVPDRNHFNVVHDFRGAGGPLCKTLLELIQIILTLTETEPMTVTRSLQEPILPMLIADLVTTLRTLTVLQMEPRNLVTDQ
jgi:arylformamidase